MEKLKKPEKIITDKNKINEIIKSAINLCIKDKINGLIVNDKLIIILFRTLQKLHIYDYDNVTISAPTGSGKSIISYLLSYCNEIISNLIYSFDESDISNSSYILTSSLILQKQINDDIEKFDMNDISTLMGSSNYECDNDKNNVLPFSQRVCLGLKKNDVITNFSCFGTCQYYNKLVETAKSNIAVLNYAYWIKATPNFYFPIKNLTICDESHLLPGIISNSYSHEVKYYDFTRIAKCLDYIYPPGVKEDIKIRLNKLYSFFNLEIKNTEQKDKLSDFVSDFYKILVDIRDDMIFSAEHLKFNPQVKKLKSAYDKIKKKYLEIRNFLININNEDFFVDSHIDENLNFGYYYEIRDLNEKNLITEYFIKRTFKSVFLSATYGNINTFIDNFEFKNKHIFKLESDFDFSNSPIYLTNSGWLNYKNFENNINSIISDVFKIVKSNKNQNGIVHTGTHYISKLIEKSLEFQPELKHKFLFYEDAKEKEEIVNKLKNAQKNNINTGFILVGPSLYEGLNLANDDGRINIIVKAPYLGMTKYVKEKMKRYPDWYFNNCLQKIEQAIGRTNRHKDDWSKVYLLDNSLKKCLLTLNKSFIDRLQYINLNR